MRGMRFSDRRPTMHTRKSTRGDSDLRAARTSRRQFLKTGVGVVGRASAMPWLVGTADAQAEDETLEQLTRTRKDPRRRVLLRGGTIISMDASVGNFATGDVLIEGRKILAVGPNIQAAAQRIDATGMILI